MKGEKRKKVNGEEKKGDKRGVFDVLREKEVVVQSIKGLLFEGTLAGVEGEYLILTNATIVGSKNVCKTPLVMIKTHQIHHVNLKGEVVPREEYDKSEKT